METTENELIRKMNEVYQYLKSIHSDSITTENVIAVATDHVQIVEKYNTLTGNQKKTMVINVIKRVVVEQAGDNTILLTVIDATLPKVIDTLVDAINGNIKFNKEKTKAFFKKLFPCCCAKN